MLNRAYLMREGGEGDPLPGPGDEGGGAGRQGIGEEGSTGRVAQQEGLGFRDGKLILNQKKKALGKGQTPPQ